MSGLGGKETEGQFEVDNRNEDGGNDEAVAGGIVLSGVLSMLS